MSAIEYISSTILTSSATSVTFSNIPQTYQDLILTSNIKGTSNSYPQISFNSDSTLSRIYITCDGSTVLGNRVSDNYIAGGVYWSTTDFAFYSITHIFGYSNTSTFKTLFTQAGNGALRVDITGNTWRSTNAINSLQYIGNPGMDIGSTIVLWGVK